MSLNSCAGIQKELSCRLLTGVVVAVGVVSLFSSTGEGASAGLSYAPYSRVGSSLGYRGRVLSGVEVVAGVTGGGAVLLGGGGMLILRPPPAFPFSRPCVLLYSGGLWRLLYRYNRNSIASSTRSTNTTTTRVTITSAVRHATLPANSNHRHLHKLSFVIESGFFGVNFFTFSP